MADPDHPWQNGAMQTSFAMRLACSCKALGIGWLVSGIVFAIVVKGPNTILGWCIWGTGFFALGWTLVGLPLIVLGERVRRLPIPLLIMAGGLGGALTMAMPALIFGLRNPPGVRLVTTWRDFGWEAIAFAIASPTTALYRLFLNRTYTAGPADLH